MQATTADEHHTQPAAGMSQRSAAKQLIVNTSAPASSAMDTVKLVGNGVTPADTCRDSHLMALGGNVADLAPAPTPTPADLSQGNKVAAAAEAYSGCVSHAALAVEAGSAHSNPEAAVAHDNQEAAAGEADAVTMAAWLIQKPHLLQGVLGHLESLAASALGKTSIPTPSSSPSAGALASSIAADKLPVVSAYDNLLVFQICSLSSFSILQSAAEFACWSTRRMAQLWSGVAWLLVCQQLLLRQHEQLQHNQLGRHCHAPQPLQPCRSGVDLRQLQHPCYHKLLLRLTATSHNTCFPASTKHQQMQKCSSRIVSLIKAVTV